MIFSNFITGLKLEQGEEAAEAASLGALEGATVGGAVGKLRRLMRVSTGRLVGGKLQPQVDNEQLAAPPKEVEDVQAAEDEEEEEESMIGFNLADENRSEATSGGLAGGQRKQATDWQLERKYTLNEIQQHNLLEDCWMVIFDKVYNITEFVNEHPGGDFILLEYAGRDATHPFLSSRHGSSAYKMLDRYWIGILVDEELYYSNNSSYCSVYSNLSWRKTSSMDEIYDSPTTTTTTTDKTTTPSSALITT